MSNRDQNDAPILITDAQRSYEEELATRKRRYGLMMGMRVPCLVLAALCYQTPWLAATLILLSVPLPWMAVIIANDRLPRKASSFRPYRNESGTRGLGAGEHRVSDSNEHRVSDSNEHRVIDQPDGT